MRCKMTPPGARRSRSALREGAAAPPFVGPERAAVPLLGRFGVARDERRLAADRDARDPPRSARRRRDRRRRAARSTPLGVRRGRAGLVTEARDRRRELDASRRDLVVPSMGAASAGDAVHASGMCPSPVRQAAGRVEPDPSGAGHEHLGPRVQIDDVARHALRLVRGSCPRRRAGRGSRYEPRRDPARAQQRDEQHRRVATAPAAVHERLFGRPHTGLVADDTSKTRCARDTRGSRAPRSTRRVAAPRQRLQERRSPRGRCDTPDRRIEIRLELGASPSEKIA